MDFYIMLCLLPLLFVASVLLCRFIQKIRRPRYIKDNDFMYMSNGGNLIKTASNKSIVVSHQYVGNTLLGSEED